MPSTMLPAYAELHCLSAFSFLRGASLPEELVAHARAQGYAARKHLVNVPVSIWAPMVPWDTMTRKK